VLLLLIWSAAVQAQNSAFTYQGKLMESGAPATGQYEMEFRLYDAMVDGVQQPVGSPVTVAYTAANGNVISVTGGVFAVQLDFGRDAFPGADRFLQISMRHSGESSFTVLSRQQINATPYAVRSNSAATADNVTDLKNQLSGAGSLNNPANPVDWTQLKNVPSSISSSGGNFTAGPGLSITGQVISNTGVLAVGASGPLSSTGGQTPTISLSGVVPVNKGGTGSASQNFVDLTTNQTISGTKTFDRIVANNLNTSGMGQVNKYDPALIATLRWDLLPRGYGDFQVEAEPHGIAFDGANIWVTNSGSNSVSRLRAADGLLSGTYKVGSGPEGIAFDGTNIWVANSKSNNVMKLSPSDGHVQATYTVGDGPKALAVVNGIVWVINSRAQTISRLSAKTGATLSVLVINSREPQQLAFDGTNVWVSSTGVNGSGVSVFGPDGVSLPSPLLKLPGAGNTRSVTGDLVFDGAHMWVSNYTDGLVTKVSARDLKVISVSPVTRANRLAYDGTYIWVTNESNKVTKLRASDGADMGTMVVQNTPDKPDNPWLPPVFTAGAIAFDGNNIWVTNYYDNSVSKR